MEKKVVILWFRRDLRLEDHTALNEALKTGLPVLPLFIFDTALTEELPANDARISFIYDQLAAIRQSLLKHGSTLLIKKGQPLDVWEQLIDAYPIHSVYLNRDYEPYAIKRDQQLKKVLDEKGIPLFTFNDQVIFEPGEIMKADGTPYTVFTPYKNRWMEKWHAVSPEIPKNTVSFNFARVNDEFPTMKALGFESSSIRVKPYSLERIDRYAEERDRPDLDSTSYLGPHLRFGTVSIRQIVQEAGVSNQTFLSELIWREFFMQILFHFPKVVTQSFKAQYDRIQWRNDETAFQRWCKGETGFPMVDAGMRQLNQTGFMHNRVRMVVASFLCKHLLIDWRWGEAYFAKKLLDYELSSNNGNWQWAAGTGCDAAPYFRVFNPAEQLRKFDPDQQYIRRWIPEWGTTAYPAPMVDHAMARNRALETYKRGIDEQS
jgi:deoxyribodipyrimidine photo-lyase